MKSTVLVIESYKADIVVSIRIALLGAEVMVAKYPNSDNPYKVCLFTLHL